MARAGRGRDARESAARIGGSVGRPATTQGRPATTRNEKATPVAVPLLKFATSSRTTGVAGCCPTGSSSLFDSARRTLSLSTAYRHGDADRENISIEINPAGEVRRGNGLTGKASGRFSAGSVVEHASDNLQRLSLFPATLPAFANHNHADLTSIGLLSSRRCDPDRLAGGQCVAVHHRKSFRAFFRQNDLGGHHVSVVRDPESYGALRIFSSCDF